MQNIVGVLFAKDLILVDPDDSIEIGTVLSFRGRHVAHCSQEAPLDEVLRYPPPGRLPGHSYFHSFWLKVFVPAGPSIICIIPSVSRGSVWQDSALADLLAGWHFIIELHSNKLCVVGLPCFSSFDSVLVLKFRLDKMYRISQQHSHLTNLEVGPALTWLDDVHML